MAHSNAAQMSHPQKCRIQTADVRIDFRGGGSLDSTYYIFFFIAAQCVCTQEAILEFLPEMSLKYI